MPLIRYISKPELDRLLALKIDPVDKVPLVATACRINTLYMIAKAGSGHIGTSFSCLDVITWLHLSEMTDDDTCFSSKGHDVPAFYALLTAIGRIPFDKIHHLRRLRGLPGHPDVGTPGIATNTGSLGMGIGKAKGMIHANRLNNSLRNVFVILGDGELQEGQIWESLTTAVRYKMGELTVVVDQNKIQSDTWTREVSDLGDVAAKFRAFGWDAVECNGHDAVALRDVFARFRGIADRPKVLVAQTLKGNGVSFMEPTAMDPVERMYKFHSGAPPHDIYEKAFVELLATANDLLERIGASELRVEEIETVTPPQPAAPQRLVKAYAEALVNQGERNSRLVALDGDLVLDCGLIPFSKRFPDRFFECGIAEQDMVSQAGGMALRGLLPVVHSFACFLSTRPNEQIYNNITEQTQIIYVGSLAGIVPGGPGHSHQSVRDMSALAGNPQMTMLEPCCEAEVGLALDYCVNESAGTCYIRLESVPVDIPFRLPNGYRLQKGRGVTLRTGTDAAIIGYGPVLLAEAYRAAESISSREQIEVAVINLPWLSQIDSQWLKETALQYPHLFLLDNHYLEGGQGQRIACCLAESHIHPLPRVYRLGLTHIPHSGTNAEVLKAHGLDAEGLMSMINSTLTQQSANEYT